jgi:hypothetical protein
MCSFNKTSYFEYLSNLLLSGEKKDLIIPYIALEMTKLQKLLLNLIQFFILPGF